MRFCLSIQLSVWLRIFGNHSMTANWKNWRRQTGGGRFTPNVNLWSNSCVSHFQVPLSDDYDERQPPFVPAPRRGSPERTPTEEPRSNFNVPSQSNKSNREKLIDKLKVRPVTTTPEPITITTQRSVREQQAPVVKKTKYAPITR